jgi:hypothetical protein
VRAERRLVHQVGDYFAPFPFFGPRQLQGRVCYKECSAGARGCAMPRLNKDFMKQSTQDFRHGGFNHSTLKNPAVAGPHYDAGYDCELLPDVRTELVAPKRPRILGPKRTAAANPALKRRLYLMLLIAVMIVGGVALLWCQEQTAERAKTNQAISLPTPAPQPTPSPTPGPTGWQPSSTYNPP